VGSGAGLDGCGKSLRLRFDPRMVQPLANSFADSANPANRVQLELNKTIWVYNSDSIIELPM
jgi:hypothetical protein